VKIAGLKEHSTSLKMADGPGPDDGRELQQIENLFII